MKILFAGETPGSSANYLSAFLKCFLKARVYHVPSQMPLSAAICAKGWDIFVFSDFLAKDASLAAQKEIARQVKNGSGLFMIGGWGSFTGLVGGWKGSIIEELLPVNCSPKDDRVNFSSGAAINAHQMRLGIQKKFFKHVPVICGMNRVFLKPGAQVVLKAYPLNINADFEKKPIVTLSEKSFPLLVCDAKEKSAALMTDVAPHWCGGLVDWGNKRVTLKLNAKVQVEVGDLYLEFLRGIFLKLARTEQKNVEY